MELCDASLAGCIERCERLALDVDIRQALYTDEAILEVPVGTTGFWQWLAKYVRPDAMPEIIERKGLPDYPEASRGQALWYSGGCESTYSLDMLGTHAVDLLSIDSFALFPGPARAHGQIHFLCAAVSAALGYRTAWLGVERHDLLLNRLGGGRYVERSAEFIDAWNLYMGAERVQSACRNLAKEEILERVLDRGLPITGTCDKNKDGTWCQECFKCYEAYYTAKAVNRSLGFKIKRSAFQRFYNEYTIYLSSDFRNNFNNAQQYFLRLQAMYGVTFDASADCIADGTSVDSSLADAEAGITSSLLATSGVAPGPVFKTSEIAQEVMPSAGGVLQTAPSMSCEFAVLERCAGAQSALGDPALRSAVEAILGPDTALLSRCDLASFDSDVSPGWYRIGSKLIVSARNMRSVMGFTCAIPLNHDAAIEWVVAGRRSTRGLDELATMGEVRRIDRPVGNSVLIASGTPVRLTAGRWLLLAFVRAWCKPDILFAEALTSSTFLKLPSHVREWCGATLALPKTIEEFFHVEEEAARGAVANVYGRGI